MRGTGKVARQFGCVGGRNRVPIPELLFPRSLGCGLSVALGSRVVDRPGTRAVVPAEASSRVLGASIPTFPRSNWELWLDCCTQQRPVRGQLSRQGIASSPAEHRTDVRRPSVAVYS